MEASVSWREKLQFVGVADSGFPLKLDSESSPETGIGPMEMVAVALAGCTAMDVISILNKKWQEVTSFDVRAHADRAAEPPEVFTKVVLEYVVAGRDVDEKAVLQAIELSVGKYCPVYAMLKQVLPIDLRYSIYEDEGSGKKRLVRSGNTKLA